jgi:hypothetical protein
MADIEFEIPSMQGFKALEKRIIEAERRGSAYGHVKYPLIASSTGSLNLIDLRYTLITNRLTWKEAQQVAFEKNATLVNINSATENEIIYNLLNDAAAIGLYPKDKNDSTVKYAWIGASDSEDADGTQYFSDLNQTVFIPNIGASEGNWKWQDGTDAISGPFIPVYSNWKDDTPDDNGTQDWGAMDFQDSSAKWIDLNYSYRLPYILEFPQAADVSLPSMVVRKFWYFQVVSGTRVMTS